MGEHHLTRLPYTDVVIAYGMLDVYLHRSSLNNEGRLEDEDHEKWLAKRLLQKHIELVKRDVFRWKMEDRYQMESKYGVSWERLLQINWRK